MKGTSMQQPAPGSKSTKFVAANPLDPMIKPFDDNLNDDQRDMQQELANNVNSRLEKAVAELQEKHRTGQNEVDDPDRAPTGPAYQAIRMQQQQQLQQQQQNQRLQQQQQQHDQEAAQQMAQLSMNDDNDDDNDDDEFDDLLNDPELDDLREHRLDQMKLAHEQKLDRLSKGHGQYRTIAQDEFLPECNTNDGLVVVHFCQPSFERCQIMDQHLQTLATQYLECKFVRLLAEKAPFFVQKLQVRTLPTLLLFHRGKLMERLVGFEGLTPPPPSSIAATTTTPYHGGMKQQQQPTDQFETWRLAKWMADHAGGVIRYKGPTGQERDDLLEKKAAQRQHGNKGGVYRGGSAWNRRFDAGDEE
eukprot:CAMPEP_0168741054 /NCGR_PEP_ID=MMETSP0724-20121128/12304_1 /TAXON_ID=265536 /ORGANISM="Amphiprora sp., Strain CCMP467" /LENGTH=359 /DNA_ID=CAMNT_0008788523 /DNA_START=72 /DNA_END=1151 /DNA_ORIENTATION=+